MKNLFLFLLLLFVHAVAFATIDCKVDYNVAFKATIPRLVSNYKKNPGLNPNEFINSIAEYDVLRTCSNITNADKKILDNYINNSYLNYFLESAKKLAESGGDPTAELKKAEVYAANLGRNLSTEKAAFKYKYEKFSALINPECKNKDLRDTEKGKMFMQNHHQGDSSWCFAFSAADLISYESGDQVSASDIALQVHEKNLESIDKAIKTPYFVHDAIDLISKRGYCLEADQPSDLEYTSIFDSYRQMVQLNQKIRKSKKRIQACYSFEEAFRGIPRQELSGLIVNTKRFLLKTINEKNCQNRTKMNFESEIMYSPMQSSLERLKKWNELLNSDKPFVVSYNPYVLTQGRILKKDDENPKISHASVVIARRFNEDKKLCEFLVRNTYPKGTVKYDQEYTPDGENVWMNAMDLANATSITTYTAPKE